MDVRCFATKLFISIRYLIINIILKLYRRSFLAPQFTYILIYYCLLLCLTSGLLISLRSYGIPATVKARFVTWSNFHGLSITALMKNLTCPRVPSNEQGISLLGSWNWKGKRCSPGSSVYCCSSLACLSVWK